MPLVDEDLRAGPPEDEDVPRGGEEGGVGVGAAAADVAGAEEADEDGGVDVRAVDHAHVAGGVVEVLQLGGE